MSALKVVSAVCIVITVVVLIFRFWVAQNKIAKGGETDCDSGSRHMLVVSRLAMRFYKWIVNGKSMPAKVILSIIVLSVVLGIVLWLCACYKNFLLIFLAGIVSAVAVPIAYRTKGERGKQTLADSCLLVIMMAILCTTLAYWALYLFSGIGPIPDELLDDLGGSTTLVITVLLVIASIVQAVYGSDAK